MDIPNYQSRKTAGTITLVAVDGNQFTVTTPNWSVDPITGTMTVLAPTVSTESVTDLQAQAAVHQQAIDQINAIITDVQALPVAPPQAS